MLLSTEQANPPVAVAVLNFNGKQHLEVCLNSLKETSYPNFGVYLVDNSSSDGSLDFVKGNFPSVKIVAFEKNLGFAEAYNWVVEMLDYEYIVFLNNDTEVAPEWLSELIKPMLCSEQVGACGSKLLMFDDRKRLAYSGGKLTFLGAGVDNGFLMLNNKEQNLVERTGYACGAGMLVKKSTFVNVGGFDSDYFAYFEDVDLCWRMWLCGYEVVFVPDSVVYHRCGASWGLRSSPQRLYLGERNRLVNMVKNLGAGSLAKAIVVSLAYDIIRVALLLVHGNFGGMRAIIQANGWFIRNLEKVLEKRKTVQMLRKNPDSDLFGKGIMMGLKEGITEFRRLQILQIPSDDLLRRQVNGSTK